MKKIFLTVLFLSCFIFSFGQKPGEVDPSFGISGIVKTDMGSPYNFSSVGKQVLIQSDGTIYFILQGDDAIIVTKKKADGSLDLSYGKNGYSNLQSINNAHAVLQADGKIIVVGSTKSTEDYHQDTYFAIIRLNIDGSLDKAFDEDGIQNLDLYGFPTSVAIQADGKIVVAGTSGSYEEYIRFGVARINTDGSLDKSFDSDGLFEIDLDYEGANSVAIQNDGKIIVAGSSKVIRLNINGTIDLTFNKSGIQTADLNISSMAIQADGRIVVAGNTSNDIGIFDFGIIRYKQDGILDSSFNNDGKQTTDFNGNFDDVRSIFIQSDGKIILIGNTSIVYYEFKNIAVAQYDNSGSLDNSYSGDGKNIIPFISLASFVNSVDIQSDGKIIALGYNSIGGHTNAIAARYNFDGSPDNSFNGNGMLIDHLNLNNTHFTCTGVQSDKKVLAAGYTWNGNNYDFIIVRFNTNGSLDKTFSSDGKQSIDFSSSDDKVKQIAIQGDGKIIVVGPTGNNFGLVRLNKDGSPDITFDADGKQTTNFSATGSGFISIQGDGKIVAGGSELARYNINGSLDPSFDTDGRLAPGFGFNDVAIQNDGKIVVAGANLVARYNIDGSPDMTFGEENGVKELVEIREYENTFYSKSILFQNDGKIIIGGHIEYDDKGGPSPTFAIIRLKTNGDLDGTFGNNGVSRGPDGYGLSAEIQSDNKIILAGYTYGIISDNFTIIRVNADGILDKSFDGDGVLITSVSPANDRIEGIAVANGRLYAAGFAQFTTILGVVAKYMLLDNKAPTASVTSPANNAVFSAPANITINASASDADGTISYVKFYNAGTFLKTDSTSLFSYTITNLQAGNYSFVAKPTDNNGLSGSSASVAVTVAVANKAPIVSITSPVNNAIYTAPANITINATASDVDGTIKYVKFYKAGTLLKTDSTAPFSFSVANVTSGNYSFVAKATDNKGLSGSSSSVAVAVSVAANKAPLVSITSPTNNGLFASPGTFTVNANASDPDGTISKVEFFKGATLLKTDSISPYTYTANNLAPGTYSYIAKAIDNKGKFSSSTSVTVSVLVVNKAPIVNITSPSNNTIYGFPQTFIVNAAASDPDGTISKVEFFKGATLLKTDSTSPFSYSPVNLAPGTYSYVAKATDNKGLFSSSKSVTVLVKANEKPFAEINNPEDSTVYNAPATFNIYSHVNDPDGTMTLVEFYNGTTLLKQTTSNDEYPYLTINNLLAGNYSFTVKAVDNYGLSTTSAPVHITVVGNGNLEAEEATLKGAIVGQSVTGFTGYGYADYINASGDYVEWKVNTHDAGPFLLDFRYANGGTASRTLQLKVNGVVVNTSLTFPPTGAWTIWSVSSATTNLIEGTNTITLTTTGTNGPNLDHLVLLAKNGSLEAEDAVLSGALIASSHPGFVGTGYADYVNASGDYIEWNVDAPTAGSFLLKFRYANGGTTNRLLQLKINGVAVNPSLAFPSTGTWTNWLVSLETVTLNTGVNEIRLTTIGSNGPNVDNLSFSSNTSIQAIQRVVSKENLLPVSNELKAYVMPNPVVGNGKLMVMTSSNLPIDFQIVDILGRTFRSFRSSLRGSNSINFPVNNLMPGSYLILLKQGNMSTKVKFIVAGRKSLF